MSPEKGLTRAVVVVVSVLGYFYSTFLSLPSRSSQCSMTGVTKAVVCALLSVAWCI